MDNLISRQVEIDAINARADEICETKRKGATYPHDDMFQGMAYAVDIIKRVPSAQPEQTNCEYCHEDSDGYVKPVEKNCYAFIRFGMDGWELSLKANGWHGSAKIKYCPMCGRKLEK